VPENSETAVPYIVSPAIPYPSSTGFAGTQSPDVASATAGAVIGRPTVSAVYVSSQLPEGRPTLAVTSGDTSGYSDDQPIHPSPLLPGSAYAATSGLGEGHVLGGGQ
jgi:hypothetical protein